MRTRLPYWLILLVILASGWSVQKTYAQEPSIQDIPLPLESPNKAASIGSSIELELEAQVGGYASAIVVQASYAYVAVGSSIQIVDISDPAHLVPVAYWPSPEQSWAALALSNDHLFAVGSAGLLVLDVSNPLIPTRVGDLSLSTYPAGISISDDHAYIIGRSSLNEHSGYLLVVNISTPSRPQSVTQLPLYARPTDLVIAEDYAYVTADGLRIIDITNPLVLTEVGRDSRMSLNLAVSGNFAYVTSGDVLRVIDITNPAEPLWTSFYDPVGGAGDVTISGHYAYITGAISIHIVDISNPTALQWIGGMDLPSYTNEIALLGQYAFVTDGTTGFYAIDVSNPQNLELLDTYDVPSQLYDLVVNNGYAYTTASPSRLYVIDLREPSFPKVIKHYGNVAGRLAVSNNLLFVLGNGLHIFDITDPETPLEVSSYHAERLGETIDVDGDQVYLFQAGEWNPDIQNYQGSNLLILDVSNPAQPTLTGHYETATQATAIDVDAGYAYIAVTGIYNAETQTTTQNGILVLDVSIPSAPVEKGFYESPVDLPIYTNDIDEMGSYCYVADRQSGLRVINFSDITAPVEVTVFQYLELSYKVAIEGHYAYVISQGGISLPRGLNVLDISDPSTPRHVALFGTTTEIYDVAITEDYVYLTNYGYELLILRKTEFVPLYLPIVHR